MLERGVSAFLGYIKPFGNMMRRGVKRVTDRGSSRVKRKPDSRKAILLNRLDVKTQVGLEIGPLCFPVVTKDESNNGVSYVDFATAAVLRDKYKDDPVVNVDAIVETDLVWGKQTLPELVEGRTFDYVIASHVIEHVPNLLGWLQEVATILKDGGILSLAIPDKRYTFDFKRELTTFGALVEAQLLDRRRPSIREVFDQISLATKVDRKFAWSPNFDADKLEHYATYQEAYAEALRYAKSEDYLDVHVNIFTPRSFLSLLENARQLGLIDFVLAEFVDTKRGEYEFFAILERLPRKVLGPRGGNTKLLSTLR